MIIERLGLDKELNLGRRPLPTTTREFTTDMMEGKQR